MSSLLQPGSTHSAWVESWLCCSNHQTPLPSQTGLETRQPDAVLLVSEACGVSSSSSGLVILWVERVTCWIGSALAGKGSKDPWPWCCSWGKRGLAKEGRGPGLGVGEKQDKGFWGTGGEYANSSPLAPHSLPLKWRAAVKEHRVYINQGTSRTQDMKGPG